MKKFFKILLVVLFPLGIIFCVGKNLFGGNFVSFLGGVFLFAIGFLVAMFVLRPDIIQPILNILR